VFAPTSAIFTLLLFAATLPNGIRLVELPGEGDSVEIIAGYTSGGLPAFGSTPAARFLLTDAYAVGGNIDFVNELDRTAVRVRVPKWALGMITDHLPALFSEVPTEDAGAAPSSSDFRERVEEEIRNALLVPSASTAAYATDHAFILMSALPPDSLREAIAAVPKRASSTKAQETVVRLPAERTLRFKSDLPAGAVIFGSPIPGVYYKQWYLVLLLDRLIRRIVPLPLNTRLPLTLRPYYYRIELPVPAGQFPEPLEETLLQELQRLQFRNANGRDLTAARDDALAYLDSKPVREWFASYDMPSRREEGMQWIQSVTADDIRVAARDLLIANRVIASWAPKPRQTSVGSEPLATVGAVGEAQARQREASSGEAQARQREASSNDRPARSQGAPIELHNTARTTFPTHTHDGLFSPLPERLSSGVSIVAGTVNAVFISGGTLTRFDRDLRPDDLKSFQQYRPDRILVLSPAASLEGARQLWSTFKGNANGEIGVPKAKVSTGDLSALFVLKTILDLELIESGWSHEASVQIDSNEGSALEIHASSEKRGQILEWIKSVANTPPPEAYFAWIREVAIHRFETDRSDLQALVWERDPQSLIPGLETVSAKQVQDVARIYF
jgi:hypothetical protein